MKHATEGRTISKNRVWIASSDGDHTKKTKLQPFLRTKFHQGNKVWIGNGSDSPDSRKSGKTMSLVLLGGSKYMLDSSKRRLKRTSTSSLTHLSSISSDRRQASVKNYLARYMCKTLHVPVAVIIGDCFLMYSCVVQRSRKHIWLGKKHKNKVLNKFKHYCIFFNRFGKITNNSLSASVDLIHSCMKLEGKCSRGDNCPYVHDPQRVAVCPK